MKKLFALFVVGMLLLTSSTCAGDNKEKWRRDALAYIDEMIMQSEGKSDVAVSESLVEIQSTQMLEKIKSYIRNAERITDMTSAVRATSPAPLYKIGDMPANCYDNFDYVYSSPFKRICFLFTEKNCQELLDCLNGIIRKNLETY